MIIQTSRTELYLQCRIYANFLFFVPLTQLNCNFQIWTHFMCIDIAFWWKFLSHFTNGFFCYEANMFKNLYICAYCRNECTVTVHNEGNFFLGVVKSGYEFVAALAAQPHSLSTYTFYHIVCVRRCMGIRYGRFVRCRLGVMGWTLSEYIAHYSNIQYWWQYMDWNWCMNKVLVGDIILGDGGGKSYIC